MEQKSYVVDSLNVQQTEAFAESVGKHLRGGEVIELVGDVGAGKTAFVRGLARGIGSTDRVSSPTFTVSNVYQAPSLTIHHYDFYRIEDVAIMQSELQEVMQEKTNIAVLEWANTIHETLPDQHIKITIEVISDEGRRFNCVVPQKYGYLQELL